jgi:acyl-coenzyme A thioesterase PaaI-like protein
MKESKPNFTLSTWLRLSSKPGGKWLFSRLVCWKAPYFGSISPVFSELRPGRSTVHFKKRRKVLNHIGTVHAIAMCNLAEVAAGTMTDATVPADLRWIPKGMTVEYLRRAETNVTAVAEIDMSNALAADSELPVSVAITDSKDQVVFRAVITMWITAKKKPAASTTAIRG